MYDHTTPSAPLRICELPISQRPVPRLLDVGTVALTDTELLAILIQADTLDAAAQLLHAFGGWHGLARATPAELLWRSDGGNCSPLPLRAFRSARLLMLPIC